MTWTHPNDHTRVLRDEGDIVELHITHDLGAQIYRVIMEVDMHHKFTYQISSHDQLIDANDELKEFTQRVDGTEDIDFDSFTHS